jgi:hypothetical protein
MHGMSSDALGPKYAEAHRPGEGRRRPRMSRVDEAEDPLRIRAAQKLSLERLREKVGCQTDIDTI